MRQALIKKGLVAVEDVPNPRVSAGSVLIKVVYSCISAGTEIKSLEASGTPLIRRAMEQPANVLKAFKMLRSHGFAKTWEKSIRMEGIGKPTGYSISGIVIATGKGITDLKPGDRVAAAGAGIANHAEFVDVPRNLVMRLPKGLDLKTASTVSLGGIAMQGVRRAQLQLGEFVVVYGTGILGLITVQMVKTAGGRCIAVDLDARRIELAQRLGAELAIYSPNELDPKGMVSHFTDGHGADIVIFTASTDSPLALSEAFGMARKKGKLIMVGVYGKVLHREDIYLKELDFSISTSYGPGRYDEKYEKVGLDYPYAYVRWTENRNMKEYLRLLNAGVIDLGPMIEGVYSIDQATKAFELLNQPERPLLVLLHYDDPHEDTDSLGYKPEKLKISTVQSSATDRTRVGVIGAGNFAKAVHLPNLKKLNKKYKLRAVCSRTGLNAKQVGIQFGAKYVTTDYEEILKDPEIDLVMICTRHNLHGQMVLESLQGGKHTFVEKPLCTSQDELDEIVNFCNSLQADERLPLLMVGYNRRFSKYAQQVKKHVKKRINPLFIHYRMNVSYIPSDHWVHTEEGGGRIIGEACHIIDLFSYLIGFPARTFGGVSLIPKTESVSASDNKSIVIEYEDGSVATLEYFAVGSQELPKEYMEVHFDGKTIIVNDYKSIMGYGVRVEEIKSKISNKGQLEELEELAKFLNSKKGEWPIPLESLIETTEITIKVS